jgi:zinc protease
VRRIGGFQMLLSVYHIPAMGSPLFAPMEAIASVLSDAPNGRLHKRLVESGKATQVFGWAEDRAEPGEINLGAVLKKDDKADEAQQILLSTVEGLVKEPVTAEELKRAQVQYANGFEKLMSDPQSLCLSLSTAIAAGDWRLLFVERDRVAALTLDQVNAAARDWLKTSNRTLGRFIPDDHPDRAPAAGKVSPEEALKGYVPKAAMASGEVFDPSPANIDARTERYTLPNGMKVALLPKKSRGEEVHVAIGLRTGNLESLKGHVQAAETVVPMLMMGTQHKTRAQLQDAFDAIHTTWGVQGGAEGAQMNLDSKRGNLLQALALAAEVLREPAFPQSELDQQTRDTVVNIEHARTEPQAVAPHELSRALHPEYAADDPRYVMSFDEAEARAKATTREQLVQAYQANWGADQGQIAIVGDFDAAQVKAEIARLFGDWKAKTPYAHISHPPSTKAGLKLVAQLKDKQNAMAVGALPLAIRDEDPDYPALLVATHVLGAGGFDSRLLTRLRQKEGVSYGVGANFGASSKEPSGSVSFYAIFAPQNLGKVQQGFTEEVARFVKDGLTADELAQAKKALLAQRVTGRANDGALASGWVDRLDDNRTFAWSGQLDKKIEALTLEQVNTAIRKWIDPSRIDWSYAGDFEKKAP